MNVSRFLWDEATKWRRPGLDTLIHYVTSACNAACDHCYFLDRLNAKTDLSKAETFGQIGRLGWLAVACALTCLFGFMALTSIMSPEPL